MTPAVLPEPLDAPPASRPDAARARFAALNATNFFLAEVVGVAVPFVSDLLRDRDWSRTAVGAAVAVAGLGTFLAQTPAGVLLDRVRRPRAFLAAASVVLGVCYGLIPVVPAAAGVVFPALFLSGVAQAVFAPALCALALGVGGPAGFTRVMGANQGWNHAGNLAAALGAVAAAYYFGAGGVFAAIFAMSVLAAGSVLLVPGVRADAACDPCGAGAVGDGGGLRGLFRDRRVRVLVAAVALFHLANAPVMPLVAVQVQGPGRVDRRTSRPWCWSPRR